MMHSSQARHQRACSVELADTEAIRDLSARLAANRLLVQASTGNTSIKVGDTLWIKASGLWLADAAAPDFLIPVALGRARSCLDTQNTIPETENVGGRCASIETAMHAALPHKVVLHVHSVNAIAWALRTDALGALRNCLRGFAWQWIPYTLSGAPLARCVQEASRSNPKANVFVLGNHGLVVCGASCENAETLLQDVEKHLHIEPRPQVAAMPGLLPTSKEYARGFRLPECPSIHGLAGDVLSRTILRGGALYPCQVLFLPSTLFAGDRSLVMQLARSPEQTPESLGAVLLNKDRVLCSITMTQSQRELLFGLSEVVRRIYESSAVHYLSSGEVSQLLHGDSGQYLTRAR
jgi:rhamnose utilization protein RhaD (predicted bifunctional aldolase and dehydrogenase)